MIAAAGWIVAGVLTVALAVAVERWRFHRRHADHVVEVLRARALADAERDRHIARVRRAPGATWVELAMTQHEAHELVGALDAQADPVVAGIREAVRVALDRS